MPIGHKKGSHGNTISDKELGARNGYEGQDKPHNAVSKMGGEDKPKLKSFGKYDPEPDTGERGTHKKESKKKPADTGPAKKGYKS